jgi:hypothetical protein
VNILTALAEKESVVKAENDRVRKAIALAWLFHLVGDVHQPLHTAQLFTVDYPQGDRGGNEICVRVSQAGQPMDLHRFWDGVITSSSNLTRLRNEATALRNRQEFQRSQLTELGNTGFESWAKESYEIATKIAYRNDGRIGIPKGANKDCAMVAAAPVLPVGYVVNASRIADRRMILARSASNRFQMTRYLAAGSCRCCDVRTSAPLLVYYNPIKRNQKRNQVKLHRSNTWKLHSKTVATQQLTISVNHLGLRDLSRSRFSRFRDRSVSLRRLGEQT